MEYYEGCGIEWDVPGTAPHHTCEQHDEDGNHVCWCGEIKKDS